MQWLFVMAKLLVLQLQSIDGSLAMTVGIHQSLGGLTAFVETKMMGKTLKPKPWVSLQPPCFRCCTQEELGPLSRVRLFHLEMAS